MKFKKRLIYFIYLIIFSVIATFSYADDVTIDASNIINWPTGSILQAYDPDLSVWANLGTYKLGYTDGSGNAQGISFGAEGTTLCFHGNAIPTTCTLAGSPGGSSTQVQVGVGGGFVGYPWFIATSADNTVTIENLVVTGTFLMSQSSDGPAELYFYEDLDNGNEFGTLRGVASLSDNTTIWQLPDHAGTTNLSYTVASGTSALGTSSISSGTCATVVTTSATGTATTDVISWGFNSDPTSTTGYTPSSDGMLTIISYPSANNVNFKVCNNTSASITPGAVTLNWRVIR